MNTYPPMNALGITKVPVQYLPALLAEDLQLSLADAIAEVKQAPPAWEIVEMPAFGEGFQPMGTPVESRRLDLTPREEKEGEKRMAAAYKKIDQALRRLDRRIAELDRTPLWKILVGLGVLLILTGIALLVAAFFRETKLELLGKGGAVTLLLSTGVALLTALMTRQWRLKTLSHRVRTRLLGCQAKSYADAIVCMQDALRELDQAFAMLQTKAAAVSAETKEVEL